MNRVFAALSLAMLFTVGAVAAPSDDPALRKAFESRYAAVRAAVVAGDAKALGAFFTPDAVFVGVTCTAATRDKVLQGTAGRHLDPHEQSHATVLSVKQDGDTAIVEQTNDMTSVRSGGGGKSMSIALHTASTDTWVRVQGSWLVKRSVTRLLDYTMNGKTVRHMEAPKTCS